MENEKISKKQRIINAPLRNQQRKKALLTMDAYSRHKLLVNEYVLNHSGATKVVKRNTENDRTDLDVLKEHHKFLWEEESEPETWEQRLAKKYYDRLFKEYCITDLSYYRQNKIALRWRTEKEVLDGKGHLFCAEKKCAVNENLKSWEVNFSYQEEGENRNALVKLRLCEQCSVKLNFKEKRKEVKNSNDVTSNNQENQEATVSHSSRSQSSTKSSTSDHRKKNVQSEIDADVYSDIDSFVSALV